MKQLIQIQVDESGHIRFHSDYDFPDVKKRHPPMEWEDGLYRELSYAFCHSGENIRQAARFLSLAADDPRADYIGLHPLLEQALVDWRREKAKALNVPSYYILHQRVLLALADEAPSTEEDLLAVPGFGPGLLKRYGEEILQLVRDNEEEDYGEPW